jgi:Pentapeptide repeats (8 copies)
MIEVDPLKVLQQGNIDYWNLWRRRDFVTGYDFPEALREENLREVDLSGMNLNKADFSKVNLTGAKLRGTVLTGADLSRAVLTGANLSGAILRGAVLREAVLRETNLNGADLRGASLKTAMLVATDFTDANLTDCSVYGASAWGLVFSENTNQQNLIITNDGEPEITVDNIEVAQFIYLLLHNAKIRSVIDTITSKAVLILGRFTDERKPILDKIRDELRTRDYLPILFDFDKPISRTTDETITLLARMARFVIADISDAKSVLQELRSIVPELPSVPVQPLIIATQEEPGMFDFYQGRPSFLPVHRYDMPGQLLADLGDRVISPAEAKVSELRAITVAAPLNPKTTP